ncbi:DUF1858 domain-containing protein [Curtanaerobium respiraculi]|uniref:DUF1858 domain-containing protein n=1 Tax=Curtanaerobium respiraculi TaxID=2949669 RepID=UPI0024B367FD|nr:DUF1858 domain-containing protein [Curtanaerobium respiraculi]
MADQKFNSNMLVGDIIRMDPSAVIKLEQLGMGCVGCPASQSESLADACMVHGMDAADVLAQLNGSN